MNMLISTRMAAMAIALWLSVFSASAFDRDSCIITGTLTGGKSENIIIFKANENPMNQRTVIRLEGNKFSFKLDKRHPEAFMVVPEEDFIEGPMRPVVIFAEDSVVIDLHPAARFDENVINGGAINREYREYQQQIQSMYHDPSTALWAAVESGELEQAEAVLKDSLLLADVRAWSTNYISTHPTMVSYYLVKMLMFSEDEQDLAQLALHYPSFAKHFPDHPYTKLIAAFYFAEEQIKDKKRFIDFGAEDLDGNYRQVHDLLAERATLINFWSSWCGPCIVKSRTMIPVYEKFREKGFDIINVATERANTDALKNLLAREKQPWKTNLVDMDGKYGVWQMYAINNLAGMMVLVDGDENVLAVNPTAVEVAEILEGLD